MSNIKYFLLVLTLLALISRIGFILTLEDKYYFDDEITYIRLAKNLVSGQGYIIGGYRCMVMPGYPLFLVPILKCFGEHIKAIRIIQTIIGSCLPLIIYLMGKFAFNSQTGKIAAVIVTFYPFFIFFDGLVLSETLFTLFFTLSFLFLVRYFRFHKLADIIFYGLTHTLATYMRPSCFFLLILVVPSIFIATPNYRRTIHQVLISATLLVLMLLPWWIRNYGVFKEFVPFTLTGGHILFESNSEKATGGPAVSIVKWPEEKYQLPEYERDAFLRKTALKWIRANPKRFAHLSLIKIKRFWNIFINFKDYSTPLYNTISVLAHLPIMILGLLGLGLAIKIKSPSFILILPAIYYSLVHLIFLGSIRYRIPIMPELIVLASFAINVTVGRLKKLSIRRCPS